MKKVETIENQDKPNNEHQFIRMFNSVTQRTDIKLLDKFIICYIISYQLEGKNFFMSNKQIAYLTGVSESTVNRRIQFLKQFFNVKHQSSGGKTNNRRFLSMKSLQDWLPLNVRLETRVDIYQFKSVRDFHNWWPSVFKDTEEVGKYLERNQVLGNYLSKISEAA